MRIWHTRILEGAVAAALLLLPASAGAHSGGVSWSGQTWHVASGTFASGQRNCPSNVHFGGTVTIRVANHCGGAISSTVNRHQGTWSVRFRDTRGGGKYAILLWPANGSRPEVDFAEDKPTDAARALTTGTYHPRPGCTGCIHSSLAGNFTQWHTASVSWTSGGFTLLMDGRAWAHYPGGGYGGQMHVSIHNEAWGSGGSSTLEVASATVR
jgi:hypothetical protein